MFGAKLQIDRNIYCLALDKKRLCWGVAMASFSPVLSLVGLSLAAEIQNGKPIICRNSQVKSCWGGSHPPDAPRTGKKRQAAAAGIGVQIGAEIG